MSTSEAGAVGQPTVYSLRAARQLDAASVEIARAQADRIRAEQEAAAQAVRARARRDEAAADAELRAAISAEHDLRAARRRSESSARRTAQLEALIERRVLLATVAVIALFVTVALPAQISFLAQRWPLPMALAGGIALESLTWVFALQGQAREVRGFSAAAHSVGIWGAAGVAAGVNLTHGAQMWGVGFAVVAACGSLAAPTTWHMYRLSKRQDVFADPERIRRERRRRSHHRKVARLADRLATSLPDGLASDTAWTLAWRAVHGAEPGITGALLERHHKAAAKVRVLMTHTDPEASPAEGPLLLRPLPENGDVAAVVQAAFANAVPLADLLTADRSTPRSGAYIQLTPRTSLPGAGPYNPRTGAYTAASPTTSAAATPSNEAAMEAKRRTAREGIRRVLAVGGTPSPTEIGRDHGMSVEWGAKQIRAVRSERHRLGPSSA